MTLWLLTCHKLLSTLTFVIYTRTVNAVTGFSPKRRNQHRGLINGWNHGFKSHTLICNFGLLHFYDYVPHLENGEDKSTYPELEM